jgi:hypothetical protein
MNKNNKKRINKKKKSKHPASRPQGRIQPEGFPVVRPDVAGIDLGSESHWVCAPTMDGAALEVEEFGATTPELERMAAWLQERKVVSVAMESTGVYWVPPHEVLERHGIEVVLVTAAQLRSVARLLPASGADLRVAHVGTGQGARWWPNGPTGCAACRRAWIK